MNSSCFPAGNATAILPLQCMYVRLIRVPWKKQRGRSPWRKAWFRHSVGFELSVPWWLPQDCTVWGMLVKTMGVIIMVVKHSPRGTGRDLVCER